MLRRIHLLMLVAPLGCTTGDGRVSVESNDLNVAYVEIDKVSDGADRVLTVRGFDGSEHELASLTLRTGMVSYTPEPTLMAPEPSYGTELAVVIDKRALPPIITPDVEPHEQTVPDDISAATFMQLRAVSKAVLDDAGIRVVPMPKVGSHETSYDYGCDGSLFPTNRSSPAECCQQSANFIFTYHLNADDGRIARRAYTYDGLACQTSGGSRNCSGSGCNFGPCRGRAEWTLNQGIVFRPNGWDQCGYDDYAGNYSPWPFNWQTDSAWEGVTASCPYTNCCNTSSVAYPWVGGCPSGPVFFDNAGFTGDAANWNSNTSFVGWGWNDRISSILVPAGWTIRIWEHADYQGASMVVYSPGIVNLSDYGFNDSISSIQIL